MEFLTVACPSCGGKLAAPVNGRIFHCLYCGNSFVQSSGSDNRPSQIRANGSASSRVDSLVEMAEHSLSIGELKLALKQFRAALEIDAFNVQAWIGYGVSDSRRNMEAHFRKALSLVDGDGRDAVIASIAEKMCRTYPEEEAGGATFDGLPVPEIWAGSEILSIEDTNVAARVSMLYTERPTIRNLILAVKATNRDPTVLAMAINALCRRFRATQNVIV